jgi:hypothetical protein
VTGTASTHGAIGPLRANRRTSTFGSQDNGDEIAELRRQVYLIGDAVKAVVPQEMWNLIADEVDELGHQHDALDIETEVYDNEDPYDAAVR